MKIINSVKKYLRKKRELEKKLRNIDELMYYYVSSSLMLNRAINSQEPLTTDSHQHRSPIVVSLTTYSVRIHSVHLVIESLSQQTIKANKIVLWLDENEFSLENIPNLLKKQMNRGLEIKFCPNYMSYKKIYPTVNEYIGYDIITLDDDFIYPHDLIEQLIHTSKSYPYAIIGQRTHKIKMEKGLIAPYKSWDKETNDNNEPTLNFITTGGGTLFPYTVAKSIFTNDKSFLDICPYADDVWVNLISNKKEIDRIKVDDPRPFKMRFIHIPDDVAIGLNKTNVSRQGNDEQIQCFVNKFN